MPVKRNGYLVLQAFQPTIGMRIGADVVIYVPRDEVHRVAELEEWIETSVRTRFTIWSHEIRFAVGHAAPFDSFDPST